MSEIITPLYHYPAGSDQFIGDPSQARIGIHPFPDKLYVVTMLSNPLRWRSRYANYYKFAKHMADSGAILFTCEIAFGDRKFEVTEHGNPRHLQLRTNDELWHKENALNLLMNRLPPDAKYIAWIDADIMFHRPDWAQETLHLLQHYDFIQMFSYAHDMNRENELFSTHTSFMFQYSSSVSKNVSALAEGEVLANAACIPPSSGYGSGGSSGYWHPGFAWAARRSSLNCVGGLIDYAILGSADWHMAWSLIGRANNSLAAGLTQHYRDGVKEWESRANQHIKQNVGYMPGSISHSFHGSKAKRYYGSRWKLLVNAKFDPLRDLKRDVQGLWQLSGNNIPLRDGIREYARLRNEDEQ